MRTGTLPSRLAALLLLVGCVLALGFLIVSPVLKAHDTQDSVIAAAENQRARFAERRRDRGRLQARLAELRSARASARAYLPQPTESLASAALIGQMKRVVQQHGGLLASASVSTGRAISEPKLDSVTVRARVRVSPEGLLKIFYQLESGLPALFLDNIRIISRPREARRSANVRRAADRSWDTLLLDVRYDVTGYLRPGEAR